MMILLGVFAVFVGVPLLHAYLHRGEDTVFANKEGR